jgi:hypothetical protein
MADLLIVAERAADRPARRLALAEPVLPVSSREE